MAELGNIHEKTHEVKRKIHKGPINTINISHTNNSSVIVTGGADYFVRLISLEMLESDEIDFVQFKR